MATFKKISAFFLLAVLLVASFALTSCFGSADSCKNGHSFTSYTSNGDATCTSDGTQSAKCDRCGQVDTKTEAGTKLSHSFTSYTSNGDATCTKNGTESAKCDNCDAIDTRTAANSKLSHSYKTYSKSTDATCTVNAIEKAECEKCGAVDYREIPNTALGHSFTNYITVTEATCTTNATEYAKCDRCDEERTVEKEDSALGHSFTNYVHSDATCTTNANDTAKCDRCDVIDVIEEADTAFGHRFENYEAHDATCTENANRSAECENGCGEFDVIEEADTVLGHSFTNYVENGDATCKKDGTETAKCDRCDVTDTKVKEGTKLSHVYVSDECKRCGDLDDNAAYSGIQYVYNSQVGGYYVTGYTGEKTKIVIPATYDGKPVLKVDLGALAESAAAKVEIAAPVILVVSGRNWDATTTLSDGVEKQTILAAGTYNLTGTAIISKSDYVYDVPYITYDGVSGTSASNGINTTVDFGNASLIEQSNGSYLELNDTGIGAMTTTVKTTDSISESSNLALETKFKIVSLADASKQYNIISFNDAEGNTLAVARISIASNGSIRVDKSPKAEIVSGSELVNVGGSVMAQKSGEYIVSNWVSLKIVLRFDNTIEISVNGKKATLTPEVEDLTKNCKEIAFTFKGTGKTYYTNSFDNTYFGTEIINYAEQFEPSWTAVTGGKYSEIIDPSTNVVSSYKVSDKDSGASSYIQFTTTAGSDALPVFVVKADLKYYPFDEPIGKDNNGNSIYGADSSISYGSIIVYNGDNQRYRIRLGGGKISDAKHNSTAAGNGTYKYGEWFTIEARYYCVTPNEWTVALSLNGEIIEVQSGTYNISTSTSTGVTKALTAVRFTNDTTYMGNYEVRNVSLSHEALDLNDFAMEGKTCLLGHTFSKYEQKDAATCTTNATEYAKCDRCDAIDVREINNTALGHSFTNYEHMEATCTENIKEVAKCDRCDVIDVKNEQENTALGHSFTKYVLYAPTCTEDAKVVSKCDRCDATDVKAADGEKLGHDFKNYVIKDEATCTTNATETATCSVCGEVDVRDIKDSSLGHDFKDYVIKDAATCTANATEIANCTRCDLTDTREIADTKLSHNNAGGLCQVCGELDPDSDGIDYNHASVGLEFIYNEKYEGYYVTAYKGTSKIIVIPATYEDKPVLSVNAEIFDGNTTVYISGPTMVTLPEGRWNVSTTLSDGTVKETILKPAVYSVNGVACITKNDTPYVYDRYDFEAETVGDVAANATFGGVKVQHGVTASVKNDATKGNYVEFNDNLTAAGDAEFFRIYLPENIDRTKDIIFEFDIKVENVSGNNWTNWAFLDSSNKTVVNSRWYGNSSNGMYYNQTSGVNEGGNWSGTLKYSLGTYNSWFTMKMVIGTDDTITMYSNGSLHSSWKSKSGLHASVKSLQFGSINGGDKMISCIDNIYAGNDLEYATGESISWTAASNGSFTKVQDAATGEILSYKVTDTNPNATTYVQFTGTKGTADTPVFVVKADLKYYDPADSIGKDSAGADIYGNDDDISRNSIIVYNDVNQRYRIRFGAKSFSDAKHNSSTKGEGTYEYDEWFSIEIKYYCTTPNDWVVALKINGELVELQAATYNLSDSKTTGISQALNRVTFTNDAAFMGSYELRNVYIGHEALNEADFEADGKTCLVGHKFETYTAHEDATCTENATEISICSKCGAKNVRDKEDTKLGHLFTNYVSNGDATCTENGTETATCERCDATDTREVPNSTLAHSFTNYVHYDANCIANEKEIAQCDNCDAIDVRNEVENSIKGHDFGGGLCQVCGELDPDSDGIDFTYSSKGVKYVYDNVLGGYLATAYEGTSTIIVIPATYDGKPVVMVNGEIFKSATRIYVSGPTTVALPEGRWSVTTALSDGSIKETILKTGSYALNGVAEIVEIEVPETKVTFTAESASGVKVGPTKVTWGSNSTLETDADGNVYLKSVDDSSSSEAGGSIYTDDSLTADNNLIFEARVKLNNTSGENTSITFMNSSQSIVARAKFYKNANGYYLATSGGYNWATGGNTLISSSTDWINLKLVIKNTSGEVDIYVDGKFVKTATYTANTGSTTTWNNVKMIRFNDGAGSSQHEYYLDNVYFGHEIVENVTPELCTWTKASGGQYTAIKDIATNEISSYKVTDTSSSATSFVQFTGTVGTADTPVFVVKADLKYDAPTTAIGEDGDGNLIYGADKSVNYNSIYIYNGANARYRIRFGNGTFSDAKHNSTITGKGTYEYGKWFTVEVKYYCVTPNTWTVELSINGELVEVQTGTYRISDSASTGVSRAMNVVRFTNDSAYMGSYEVRNVYLSHEALSADSDLSGVGTGKCVFGHDYHRDAIKAEAGCDANAIETVKCSRCGDTKDREVENSALGHSYETTVLSEASCDANAVESVKCLRCVEEYTREVENTALGHDFASYEQKSAASCDANAIEISKCSRCDATDEREIEGTALGHSFGFYVPQNATCTENAKATAKCSKCDAIDVRGEIEGTALGHSFSEENYVSDNNATCTENGTETAKCDRCDETHTREVADSALGHSFTNYEYTEATCTTPAGESAKCDRCDATDVREDVSPALGHDFANYEIKNEATCTEDAIEISTCSRCDATHERVVEDSALGHDLTVTVLKEATCTENAVEFTECSRCDYELESEVEGSAGHKYEGGICSVCEEISPDGIDFTYPSRGLVFTYNSKSGGYYVTAYEGSSTIVVIPATYTNPETEIEGPVLAVSAEIFGGEKTVYVSGPSIVSLPEGRWAVTTTLEDGVKETTLDEGTYSVTGIAKIVEIEVPETKVTFTAQSASGVTVGPTKVSWSGTQHSLVTDATTGDVYLKSIDASSSNLAGATITTSDVIAEGKNIVFEAKINIVNTSGTATCIAFQNSGSSNIARIVLYKNANGYVIGTTGSNAYYSGSTQSLTSATGWIDLKIVIRTTGELTFYVNGTAVKTVTYAAAGGSTTKWTNLKKIAFTSGGASNQYEYYLDNAYLGYEIVDANPLTPETNTWTAASAGVYTVIKSIETNEIKSYKVSDKDSSKNSYVEFKGTKGTDAEPVFVIKADMLFYQFDEAIGTDSKGNPIYGADSSAAFNSILTFSGSYQRYRVRFGNGSFSNGSHNVSTVGKANAYKYGEWFTVELKLYSTDAKSWKTAVCINGETIVVYSGSASVGSTSTSTAVSKGLDTVRFTNDAAYMGNYEVRNVSLTHIAYDANDFVMP